MSGGQWALLLLGVGVCALLLSLSVVLLVGVLRLLKNVSETVEGITQEVIPVIGGLNETVSGVNVELARVDSIVAGVQNITATADSLVGVVHATVSNPLIKVAAFTVGAARGARKLRG